MTKREKYLIRVYLKAETDIINEIARLRSLGLADYHAVAALRRVQKILAKMQSEAWTYAPRMIEEYFYVEHPDIRVMPTTSEGARRAYISAMAITSEQMDIANKLTMSLLSYLDEASKTVVSRLEDYLVGRRDLDIFRQTGLAISTEVETMGTRRGKVDQFVKELQRNGITAFTDKAGRNWRLSTYATMVTRTTTRQAEVLSVLTKDPEQDLYTVKGAADPCGVCAAYQNRVYSKSGTDPYFPPLADIFGKIDKNGPNTLENTWMNIHPNCRCALVPWTPAGRSKEELSKIIRFSDPETNPYDKDPRTQKAIDAYRKKEEGRRKWRDDYDQWQRYRVTIPDQTPKTFSTFMKHKSLNDEKYQEWMDAYRHANEVEKYSELRYHDDGTVVVTDVWIKHRTIPATYKPNAVVETRFDGAQTDRVYYDDQARMTVQIHSGPHNRPDLHTRGEHGEHAHDIIWEDGKIIERRARDLSDRERIENADIL